MQEIKVLHDQHLHTHYSEDSSEKLVNYFEKAKELGFSYFISCEHVDFDPAAFAHSWIADFKGLKEEVKDYEKEYQIKALFGIELGYRKDKLAEMKNILKENYFDLVQLSVHDDSKVDYYMSVAFQELPKDLKHYFNNVIDAVTTFKDYDILSHFDYGYKTAVVKYGKIDINDYLEEITEIFKIVIADNKVLEINIKVQDVINDSDYLKRMLKLYKDLGGNKLALSSDAHEASYYHLHFDKYMKIIKDCGFNDLSYFINRKEYKYHLV